MRPLERLSGPSREPPAEDIRQRLRDLPQEAQPPYDWAEFRRRERERPWPGRGAVKWEHAAAAAGITVLIASMAMWGRASHQPVGVEPSGIATAPLAASGAYTPHDAAPIASESHQHAEAPSRNTGGAAHAATRADVADVSLVAQAAVASQLAALGGAAVSKRWLEQQPSEPVVVRVGSRLAVANLEDRIAWVDDALTDAQFGTVDPAGLQALRRQRARLVSSLAQVRYAETLAAQVN